MTGKEQIDVIKSNGMRGNEYYLRKSSQENLSKEVNFS